MCLSLVEEGLFMWSTTDIADLKGADKTTRFCQHPLINQQYQLWTT